MSSQDTRDPESFDLFTRPSDETRPSDPDFYTRETIPAPPPPVMPRPKRGASHVVWTLHIDGEGPKAPAVWGTDGVVMSESKAVKVATALKNLGTPAVALMLGREPQHVHPSERPHFVRA